MELKLSQELASIDQEPLLLVFLDISKSYDTMDRKRLLVTLTGYGAVSLLCGLLETLWDIHKVVPRQNVFHGPAIPATRGTMQGGLLSLTIFNVVVDNSTITWLVMTVEDQRVAHEWLGDTSGRCLGVFYDNDGMVGSRDAYWLQKSMKVLVGKL